jgi:hypothetical protein
MATEENKTEKKKKGFFSKIANVFLESEGTENEVAESVAQETSEEISVVNSGSMSQNPVFSIPVTGDGAFDKNFADAFQQLIFDNDLPGVDYVEFSKALKQMSGVGLNESVLFQTVFTTLKVSAPTLTKKTLQDAVDTYINLLKSEEQEFKEEMQANVESEVVSRRTKAESLNLENKELVQQIQDIQEKISQNQQEALKLNGEAADIESKISQTHKNFTVTLASVIANLETDKAKIEQLINEA